MIDKILFHGKALESPKDQNADFVELFFDLVFVYAITSITALTAHHLDGLHIVRSVLVFWLIWWGWTQFTWALNAANTRVAPVRMIVLIATGVAFVMASSVGDSFSSGAMWFAIPYIVIRTIGLGLYIRVTSNLKDKQAAVISFAIPSILGLLAVLAGGLANPGMRIWWWLAAIVLDMIAGYIGGKGEGWDLQAGHFAERHGLIVIIALGESLIVAANAVSEVDRSQDLLIIGGLAVLVTCLLWWSYFAWVSEFVEGHLTKLSGSEQAQTGRDAYSFIHFPLLCGIIGMAVGFEKILHHPHELINLPTACALFGGYGLFVGSTAAFVWRTSRLLLQPRLLFLLVSLVAGGFSIGRSPQFALGIIAAAIVLMIAVEWRMCKHT